MSALSLKSIFVTAALGLSVIVTAGAGAQAAPLTAPAPIPMASGASNSVVDVQYREHMRRDREHFRRGAPHRAGVCSTRDARQKAARMGIRNGRVIDRGRSVVVRGFRHGRPASVGFANVRGCPIIR